MSHRQQRAFCEHIRDRFPKRFRGKRVLDVGSLNVNGTNRRLFNGGSYLGVDILPGDGVDLVGTVHDVQGEFDVIISTEMLEHDPGWRESVLGMIARLAPGGFLILTCAGPGRVEHGTRNCPDPGMENDTDYYGNISLTDMLAVVREVPWQHLEVHFERGHCDTYLFGVLA